jgi:glycosyltransferase involved in cell wall biosynthesis
MIELYGLATRRRDLLGDYRAIVTASPHMQAEYGRYGVTGDRVHVVDLMMPPDDIADAGESRARQGIVSPESEMLNNARVEAEWRLVFIGRLTELKGPRLLLAALPHLQRSYHGRITLTVIGDGPDRVRLEARARELCKRFDHLSVRFTGWLESAERGTHLRRSDLLVVPSVWPEPFGLVGPEAGLFGVPAAAFGVGGIPAWLTEGVNGHLAPGRRPTPKALATAIARSLRDPVHHARLRDGARAAARRYTVARHLKQIIPILERAATG